MRLRLDVLNVPANRPGGRATLDEVKREAGAFAPSESQTEKLKRFPEISEIDIFMSGLVFPDHGFLQITDAGRSLLHSLESASVPVTSPTITNPETPDRTVNTGTGQPYSDQIDGVDAIRSPDAVHRDHLVVVPSPGFRSTFQDSDRKSPRRAEFFAALAAKARSAAGAWRNHVEHDVPVTDGQSDLPLPLTWPVDVSMKWSRVQAGQLTVS